MGKNDSTIIECTEATPLCQSSNNDGYQTNHKVAQETTPSSTTVALTITIALFGVFLANADESLVVATYSTIASEFQDLSDGPWLLMAYNLGFCLALPIYGSISDVYGRKRPLLAAYCLFGIGCIIVGTAASLPQAVGGRVIAGIGGSGMNALICVIITDMTTHGQTAVLRSYVNIAQVLGRSVGAPLGGWLADTIGWRWTFFSEVPLAALWAVLIARIFVSDSSKFSNKARSLDDTSAYMSPVGTSLWLTVDWLGAITFAASITLALSILTMGGKKLPWSDPATVSLFIAAGSSALAFLLVERFVAAKPLISLKLLKTNGVGVFCGLQVLLMASRFGTNAQIPPFFVRTQHATDAEAGAYLIPSNLGNAVGALVAGHLINRTSRYKALSAVSFIFGFLGYLLMTLRWRHEVGFWESWYSLGGGLNLGILLSALFIGLTANAPASQRATAISIYYLGQQIGVIFGVGSFATVLDSIFRNTLKGRLVHLSSGDEIIDGVLNDARFQFLLSPRIQGIVVSSYLYSFQFVPVCSLVCLLLALPVVLSIREQPIR